MPADAHAQSSEFFAKLQPGSKLAGCYLLEKRVEGSSQPLWLARDEVLDKSIALYFLPPGILTRGGVAERLRQEVKRARQLVHPRVLRVHDLIEEEEWAAVAMDSFSGQPLAVVAAGNPHGFFEVTDVWPLARELCETLEAAHQVSMVHGGLSLGDVLVGNGQAKVMNFGISAALREEGSAQAFASAQLLSGAMPTVADDVFALGALLHTLLAGAPPFEGAERKGAPSISEHRQQLKHRGGDVAENWECVIASCLAEDPAARPVSCAEIARMLDPDQSAQAPAAVAVAPVIVEAEVVAEAPAPAPVAPEKEVDQAPVVPESVIPEPVVPEPVVPEPKVERPIAEKPAPQPLPVAPVDQDALAAKVRREEAEEEARERRTVDEDDGIYEQSRGRGPSMLTLVIVVAFASIVIFICYRVFFTTSSAPRPRGVVGVGMATPAPAPTAIPSTPAPVPVVMQEAATPVPVPATPAVAVMASPKPMAQPDERDAVAPKQLEAAISELKLAREKVSKDLPAVKKSVEELDAQHKKLADDLKNAEAAAQEAETAATDRRKLAADARKAAMAAAELLVAKKSAIANAEEQLVRLELALKDKERVLRGEPGAPEASSAARSPQTGKPLADPTLEDPFAGLDQKMKELSKAIDGAPDTKSAVELAKQTTPAPEKAAKADVDGLMNSLGMRLVPLEGADVLVCIWPARVRDFETFAKATGLKSNLWKDPGFKQTPDHPVVNVSWQDAIAFCKWLTTKEQKEGVISEKQSYRLLTDLEWSRAAGLGAESGSTPEARDMGVQDVYPWGNAWPPPTGAGNYTGEETNSEVAIKGYDDGFAWTSPVGSFPANKHGLYDMGGNVWQWCMDSWNAGSKAKVLRGASWYNGALKLSLLSSCRVHASPDSSTDNYGFRVALSTHDGKRGK